MVKLKDDTVSLAGMVPQMFFSMMVVNDILQAIRIELVITSGSEAATKHMKRSKHYTGEAYDFRSRDIKSLYNASEHMIHRIATQIRSALSKDFDLVVESDHFHIEWDPKVNLV